MLTKFSHLSYFVAIAEEQSFNKAAARLHLSQPTLSRQIRDLETQLGVELFVRGRDGTTLTKAGELMLEHARDLLAEREALVRAVQRTSAGP